MALGGPVWHASVGRHQTAYGAVMLERHARGVLDGVGDATLGEWVHDGGTGIVYVRRRLSDTEAGMVGPVKDIRGTEEARWRYRRIPHPLLARIPPEVMREELGV